MQILAEDNSTDFECNHNDMIDPNRNVSFDIIESRPSSTLISPFSPLLLIESLTRKSFSYGKLPLEPIKLTVVKLDGSSFDITVSKNPTVAQLKQGVEAAFSHLPKHGTGKVSWSHVWAQFCLCFEGQRLVHEQDSVSLFGIKDGDQLQFVRHTSISYNLVKERSEKRDFDLEESEVTKKKDEDNVSSSGQDNANEEESYDDFGVNVTCQCGWGHLFRRLFLYRRQKGHDTSYKELGSLKSLRIST